MQKQAARHVAAIQMNSSFVRGRWDRNRTSWSSWSSWSSWMVADRGPGVECENFAGSGAGSSQELQSAIGPLAFVRRIRPTRSSVV